MNCSFIGELGVMSESYVVRSFEEYKRDVHLTQSKMRESSHFAVSSIFHCENVQPTCGVVVMHVLTARGGMLLSVFCTFLFL